MKNATLKKECFRKIRTKKHEEVAVVPKEQGPCYITTTNLTVKILSECTGKSVKRNY